MAGKALIPQSTTASRATPVLTCPPIPTYSPAVTRRVVESAFDTWRATVDGTVSYWRTAWERGLTPLRVLGVALLAVGTILVVRE